MTTLCGYTGTRTWARVSARNRGRGIARARVRMLYVGTAYLYKRVKKTRVTVRDSTSAGGHALARALARRLRSRSLGGSALLETKGSH